MSRLRDRKKTWLRSWRAALLFAVALSAAVAPQPAAAAIRRAYLYVNVPAMRGGQRFVTPSLDAQGNSIEGIDLATAAHVLRGSAGVYGVHFPFVPDGIDQVQISARSLGHYCNLNGIETRDDRPAGNKVIVVDCFDLSGRRSDSAFSVSLTGAARYEGGTLLPVGGGGHLFVDRDHAGHINPNASNYNRRGLRNVVRYRGGGKYVVVFPGLAQERLGVAQVTATRIFGRCKVSSVQAAGSSVEVRVRCFNSSGEPTSGNFMLRYWDEAPPRGGYALVDRPFDERSIPRVQASSSGRVVVERLFRGAYQVKIGRIGSGAPIPAGAFKVSAFGASAAHCEMTDQHQNRRGDQFVGVVCRDPSGRTTDTRFGVHYVL